MIKKPVLLAVILLLLAWATPAVGIGEPYVVTSEAYVASPGQLPQQVECSPSGELGEAVYPGSTVYFPIQNARRAEDLTGLRAYVDWTHGSTYCGTPMIEYRMLYSADGEEIGYRYVVSIEINEIADSAPHTISGGLKVSKLSANNVQAKFSFTVRLGSSTVTADSVMCEGSSFTLDFGKGAGQTALLFSSYARFEIDAEGQGPINVGYSTDPFGDYVESYPDNSLGFISWTYAPIFNRVGQLLIYTDESSQIYELEGDKLVACDAYYSVEYEAYVIETRRLGSYVISDGALGDPVEPVRTNPATGARIN